MSTLFAMFLPLNENAAAHYAELAAALVVFLAISVSAAGIGLGVGTRNRNMLWPAIRDAAGARSAARQGMWAAFVCSGITAITAFLANNGVTLAGDSPRLAVLRAVLFGLLAIGIQRLSRSAAILALLVFLIERAQGGGPIALTVILLICFVNGIRGTAAYHKCYPAAANTSDGVGLPRCENRIAPSGPMR